MTSRKKSPRKAVESAPSRPNVESLESRELLSASSAIVATPNLAVTPLASRSVFTGYTPAQIKSAYGFNAISGNGSGQTIAIVDAYNDPNIASDLHAFDAKFGLPDPKLVKINQNGGSTASVANDAGWASEIALDVEWAHAIAPGATIVLVEANSASITDLMTAVNTARNYAGVSVVSMSWGTGEFFGQTRYGSLFTTPAGHQGVTFVASAGDSGSFFGPEWPSSSSNVLAVGGTTLNLTSTGAYSSETGWSAGGGGVSFLESEPGYQQSVQLTGARSAPDVSYNANPNTGFALYDSFGGSGWSVVGGTSAGAPQWAALIALADQARVAAGKSTLDGATGTLPTLYSLYNSSGTYSASFNDVTIGRTSFNNFAGTGYDAVSGLGTPKAAAVVASLVGTGTTTTPVATKTTTTITATRSNRGLRLRFFNSPVDDSGAQQAIAVRLNDFAAQSSAAVYALSPDGRSAASVFDALAAAPDRAPAAIPFASAAASRFLTPGAATESSPLKVLSTITAPIVEMQITTPLSTFVSSAAATSMAVAPFNFSHADPAALLNDAIALFTRDSLATTTTSVIGALGGVWSTRPWAATAFVIAADAALVGYYVARRSGKRKASAAPAGHLVILGSNDDACEPEFSLVPLTPSGESTR